MRKLSCLWYLPSHFTSTFLVVLGYPRVNSSEAIPFVVTRSPTQPTCTPTTQASATALECVVSDSREEENIATYLLSSSQDTRQSL